MMPFMTVFTYTHFTRKTILQFSMEVFLRAKKKKPTILLLEILPRRNHTPEPAGGINHTQVGTQKINVCILRLLSMCGRQQTSESLHFT